MEMRKTLAGNCSEKLYNLVRKACEVDKRSQSNFIRLACEEKARKILNEDKNGN